MKFRYFILQGKSLKTFKESEVEEMKQRKHCTKALLEDRDDIENFRPGRTGGVLSIVFKEGKQPEGFVRAHKDLSSNEVRPHGKSKIAKPWRELLKSLKVTEDCQEVIIKEMKLPNFVVGESVPGRFGCAMYTSRIGHVGKKVFVEVPVSTQSDEPYEPHADLKEVKNWQFEKAVEEGEGFDYGSVYTLSSRVS